MTETGVVVVSGKNCIGGIEHAQGVTPKHSAWKAMQEWIEQQPQAVQFIAAEWNYGLLLRFHDGVFWVAGYIPEGVLVSPLCPQCHGDTTAANHPGAMMLDPAKLRSYLSKH